MVAYEPTDQCGGRWSAPPSSSQDGKYRRFVARHDNTLVGFEIAIDPQIAAARLRAETCDQRTIGTATEALPQPGVESEGGSIVAVTTGGLAGVKVIELSGIGPGPHAGWCSPTPGVLTWCGCAARSGDNRPKTATSLPWEADRRPGRQSNRRRCWAAAKAGVLLDCSGPACEHSASDPTTVRRSILTDLRPHYRLGTGWPVNLDGEGHDINLSQTRRWRRLATPTGLRCRR